MPSKYPKIRPRPPTPPPPEEEQIFEIGEPEPEEVAVPVMKEKKPKRKATPAQLAHLSRIREKAKINREKKKADALKEAKAQQKKELDETEFKPDDETTSDEEYEEAPPSPKPKKKKIVRKPKVIKPEPSRVSGLTKEELREIAREEIRNEKSIRKKKKDEIAEKQRDIEKARAEGIAYGAEQTLIKMKESRGKKPNSSLHAPIGGAYGNEKLNRLLGYR